MKFSSRPLTLLKTPLVCADSQLNVVDLQNAMESGVNIVKFKLAHSSRKEKALLLGKVDKAVYLCCEKYGVKSWPVAVCASVKTCIVRTGLFEGGVSEMQIKEDSEVIMTHNHHYVNKCNERYIYVDNSHLMTEVSVGMEVNMNDGDVTMNVVEKYDAQSFRCKVIRGGTLLQMSNVCARGMKHSRPHVTRKDIEIIGFCLQQQVDMILLNYVRSGSTVRIAKRYMKKYNSRPVLLGGLCTEECLDNLDEILMEADGIVLSREFLAYELSRDKMYRLELIQKNVAAKCEQAGKPLFISGGILKSALSNDIMADNEISDITNFLLDGGTGFILKECYNMNYMINAIKSINDICNEVEPLILQDDRRILNEMKMPINAAEGMILGAVIAAKLTQSLFIILPTVTGKTVKHLLWMHPPCVIIAVSTKARVLRMLYTCRNVVPVMYHKEDHHKKGGYDTITRRLKFALDYAVNRSWLDVGDNYITLEKSTVSGGYCDMMRVRRIDAKKRLVMKCPDEYYESLGILKPKEEKPLPTSVSEENSERTI